MIDLKSEALHFSINFKNKTSSHMSSTIEHSQPKERLGSIELARLLGLLAVIYLHVHAYAHDVIAHWWWSLSLYGWMSFFFFISAYFSARKGKISYKKTISYIYMYFGWNLIVFLLSFARSQIFSLDPYSMSEFLIRMIGIGAFPWDYPLWFLRELIILQLISFVFLWLSKYPFIYLLLLTGLGISIYLWPQQGDIGTEQFLTKTSLFFFAFGFFLGRINVSSIIRFFKRYSTIFSLLFVIIILLYGFQNFSNNILWNIIGVFGIILLCYEMTTLIPEIGVWASKCTPVFFFVYASHICLIEIIWAVFRHTSWCQYAIIGFPPVYIVLSIYLYRLISRHSPLVARLLFGRVPASHKQNKAVIDAS